jgi:hypothetical protein
VLIVIRSAQQASGLTKIFLYERNLPALLVFVVAS